MTNQQLYTAVGLPTLTSLITLILVVLAWVSTHATTKDLRAEMDRRIDRLETRMEKRFDAVDARFDAIDVELRYFRGERGNHEACLAMLQRR